MIDVSWCIYDSKICEFTWTSILPCVYLITGRYHEDGSGTSSLHLEDGRWSSQHLFRKNWMMWYHSYYASICQLYKNYSYKWRRKSVRMEGADKKWLRNWYPNILDGCFYDIFSYTCDGARHVPREFFSQQDPPPRVRAVTIQEAKKESASMLSEAWVMMVFVLFYSVRHWSSMIKWHVTDSKTQALICWWQMFDSNCLIWIQECSNKKNLVDREVDDDWPFCWMSGWRGAGCSDGRAMGRRHPHVPWFQDVPGCSTGRLFTSFWDALGQKRPSFCSRIASATKTSAAPRKLGNPLKDGRFFRISLNCDGARLSIKPGRPKSRYDQIWWTRSPF